MLPPRALKMTDKAAGGTVYSAGSLRLRALSGPADAQSIDQPFKRSERSVPNLPAHAQGQVGAGDEQEAGWKPSAGADKTSGKLYVKSLRGLPASVSKFDLYKLIYADFLFGLGQHTQHALVLRHVSDPDARHEALTGWNCTDLKCALSVSCSACGSLCECKGKYTAPPHLTQVAPIAASARSSNITSISSLAGPNPGNVGSFGAELRRDSKANSGASSSAGYFSAGAVTAVGNLNVHSVNHGGAHGQVAAVAVHQACGDCSTFGVRCALCNAPVKGLCMICVHCGHGGHPAHMKHWFASNTLCPTGCGCVCQNK